MTRTDIYKASKSIFPSLPDEETFAIDMQDTEKANRAFQSALNNKDKYEEMGVTLPETVEEFQSIVTTDPKKKSTNTGSNGSQKTQQSSGSKPAQSSQQGPKVFQPQRVFNSIEEIDNYFYYLDQYKNDPKAQKEKIWFEQEHPNITNQFFNQGGKPLTVQGPVYEDQKQASVLYQSNLPKVAKKSNVDNRQFLKKEEEVVKTMPEITDEELMQGVMGEISPRQDNLNVPLNIQQEQVRVQKQIKREEEGQKVKGKTAKELVSNIEKENFYSDNYPKIESLINNDFGTRSNDIDFTKLNVNNRSELEDAYGRLEQDYLEYLQKTDPQEYERVNNEITSIRSKKGSDINRGERMVIDNFRSKAMEMHNLVNGYIMHEIEKNYDLPAYFGAASAMSMQIDSLDKQIQNLGIDPSGRGVSPAKAQQYQSLVDQRNKLVGEYNGLDEKFAIPKEVVAKYEDVANRYLDNSVIDGQLNNLDTELAAKRKENMKAAQDRFNEAFSGDYSIAGEVARGFTNTVGRSAVDLVTTAWDVIGETTGDTDYDIWDEIANFGRGYNFEKEKTFGAAQDFGFEPREYSELPLAYRMAGLTGSGLGSVTLSAAGAVLTGGLGLGSTVGGGVLMLGSSLSDNYNEALRNGYSGKDAGYYASTMAGIEMAVESLFPDFDFLKSPEGKKQLLRSVVNSKTPKEAFEKLMSGLPENIVKEFKIAGNNFFKEGVVEEGGSQFISDIVKSKFNEKNKDKGQFEVFKGQDYQDAVLGGFLGAESANIIGRMASPKMPHEESIIYQAAINPDILSLSERNSIVVSDEMKDVIALFKDIDNAMKSKPGYSNLSDDEKAHVVSEVQRMKYLEEQNKKVGIDDKATQDEISNIKSEVDTILNDSITKTKENAIQEPSTEEVLPRQQGATTETGGEPQGMGQDVQGEEVTQEGEKKSVVLEDELLNNPELIEQRRVETVNQIERGDLFDGVGDFSTQLGGSDKAAVPVNRQKINEIEFVQYAHPETGSVDVVVTGTGENDFVGFYRIYENGKPTNKWSSKFENRSRNKEDFKTMISNVQEMLPKGHEYTETTSISTDGLRIWNQQLERGYELQYDSDGNVITKKVAINGDAINNELGIPVNVGDFENIKVQNKEDFEKVKKVLLPYLEKFGLGEKNINWLTGTVKIDLPVLKKSSQESNIQKGQEVSQEGVKKEDVVNQPFGELPENTEDFTGIGAGYLKNNLWASKQLGKDSKTSLLGNIKNEVLNKGKKAFLYFIDPKLSEGQLDTENKYNTKLNDKINAQGNKTLTGAENAAIENEVGAELAKEGVKGELVSDEKDGTYRIFDTKNTELLGYIEATPELIEKISDPNISEEQAKQILFDEAGVKMGDNVLIHANENDLSKYKTQKDVESEDYVGKLEDTKKQKPKDYWSVSTPPVGDVKGGTLIKVKGGEAIVDKTGEIRGLYKYPDTEERGVGDQLVKKGIEAGGVKLDNFALDNLMNIYQRNGFKVVSRLPFSEKDAPEGWNKKEHGTPDVVAMIYDPENKLDIEEKQFTKDQYDEALAYRDSFVDAQKEAYGEQKPSQDEEAKRKSIADIIRGLKSKGGKLYSAGLGIPAAIWDGAVEIIASAVEAGEGLVNGINKAKKYLQDKLKDRYNEDLVDELLDNVINQSPVEIQSKSLKGDKVKVNPEGHNLSFVKSQDLIDIESLIKDIESKNEKVWFWVADQLGRGIYADKTTGNEHFLDAGPSYALDPKNREKGIIWASGMPSAKIGENIKNSDYIFIISGSPTQSKLFNKAVFKLFQDKLGDYKKFKNEVLNAKTTKGIREVLNAHNSWETLIEDPSTDNPKLKKVGTGRKKFLIELINAFDKPNSGLHQILKSKDALLDINSIRDGFYADNNFDVNDIMLVLKPEKLGGKSEHSTYENDILGEVIGVPDKKIDAYNILPNYLRKESDTNKPLQTARVAPYGSGIREVSATEAIERETKSKAEAIRSNKINDAVEMLSDAQETGGTEVTKAQKEVTEKLGEEGKKIAEIDRNFDKLADDLGFIKTCII